LVEPASAEGIRRRGVLSVLSAPNPSSKITCPPVSVGTRNSSP
jgi:hypothetical protein